MGNERLVWAERIINYPFLQVYHDKKNQIGLFKSFIENKYKIFKGNDDRKYAPNRAYWVQNCKFTLGKGSTAALQPLPGGQPPEFP